MTRRLHGKPNSDKRGTDRTTERRGTGLTFSQHAASAAAGERRGAEAQATTDTPVTIERLEAALLMLATLMELDGNIHIALFERLEAELASRTRLEETRERARRLLDAYNRSGDAKAIWDRNLNLSSKDGPRPYFGL